ncbi:hypothetical protein CEQ21_04525 [Niallia circulans]|uniref:Lipoprotein n=1 Tax=Niallia circulans TaxID=1397 RepID=A0A553ST94_NIACI|nr:hypothetical protein [Niallia circulans]TRZ40210.1 hypothetical protein CEQ21_04525 [Niallia circulans]
MIKKTKLTTLLLCLLIVASFLSACESQYKEGIRSDRDDSGATETLENKHSKESEDPVYQETGGLYTEEDLKNAKPLEMPVQD